MFLTFLIGSLKSVLSDAQLKHFAYDWVAEKTLTEIFFWVSRETDPKYSNNYCFIADNFICEEAKNGGQKDESYTRFDQALKQICIKSEKILSKW